jgi:acid stress chaperone HdeB
MKSLAAAAFLIATLATGSASAQVLDLSTVKCKDFVQSGNENITLVLMWLTGYYADQDASPIVDFTKMKADATKIGEYCATNPDNGLITAAEEVMQ